MIESSRLILRQWKEEDLIPFAEMNSDSEVMEYFPSTLSKFESDQLANKIEARISKNGWGFWAVQTKEEGKFIGFVGLNNPESDFTFKPCVEIGWRLAKQFWFKGYATEAAVKSLEYAFNTLNLSEVVSFTTVKNLKSQKVMQKIGMLNTGNNFMHPSISLGHSLSEHVLYKISKQQWASNAL